MYIYVCVHVHSSVCVQVHINPIQYMHYGATRVSIKRVVFAY